MFPGWLFTLLILLPNVLMLLRPPQQVPGNLKTDKKLEALERAGQAGCFILPIFYQASLSAPWWQAAGLGLAAAALLFYYAGWLRYLLQGQAFRLLFAPMCRVPIPLAVAPVIYFFAAGLFLAAWPLALAALLLAAGHLGVSWQTARQVKEWEETHET